jgi:hypothetical protein
MAKKENRIKKREQEREAAIKAREARFKKNGYISLGTIVVCTVLMYVVAAKLMGTVLGINLLIFSTRKLKNKFLPHLAVFGQALA